MFSCGIAVSATATYAWYSIVEKDYIRDLNIQVTTDEEMGLKMGMKQENGEIDYKNHYTKEDFIDEYAEDGKFYLKQVSAMYEEDWKTLDLSEAFPKFHTAYISPYRTRKTDLATGEEYLQHEFWLYSEVECAIMLGEDSGFFPDVNSNSIFAREEGVTVEELNDVKDATRVSFLFDNKYIIVKNNGSVETKYAGLLDLTNDGYFDYEVIEDDNGNKIEREVIFGEYIGEPTYLPPLTEEEAEAQKIDFGEKKRNVFLGNHKAGVLRADPSSVQMIKEDAHDINDYIFNDDRVGEKLTPLLYLEANTPKRIVITTYLEGWDLKMTDLLNKASLDVNVSFIPLYNYPIFD